MKKIAVILAVLIMGTAVFSMSKNKFTAQGYIGVYGNEPFVYPCLKTEDKVIPIQGSKELLSQIFNSQGRKIIVKGELTKDKIFFPDKDVLIISEWTYADKE